MGIKFSMKDDGLMVQSDNTAFVSAAPPKKTNRQLTKEEEAKNLRREFISCHAYKVDFTDELGEDEPKDWTKTHYAKDGYWVPKHLFMHRGYTACWWHYESFEVFAKELDIRLSIRNRRRTPEESEVWGKIVEHRKAYADKADEKYIYGK